jgi:hypothetical protein
MSWQLELIDPRSGSLTLDDSEERDLLDAFAGQCGLGARKENRGIPPSWHVNPEQCDVPLT